jgi:guanine nucleotide-binding protein subunit beta-2-like 1 protein
MVTSIVTGVSREGETENEVVVSGSRDKKLIIWRINQNENDTPQKTFGEPYISLTGHNHFISDLCISKDASFLLSSSWDKSLRLWSLKTGKCKAKFFGEKKEIMSCCLSNDSR